MFQVWLRLGGNLRRSKLSWVGVGQVARLNKIRLTQLNLQLPAEIELGNNSNIMALVCYQLKRHKDKANIQIIFCNSFCYENNHKQLIKLCIQLFQAPMGCDQFSK